MFAVVDFPTGPMLRRVLGMADEETNRAGCVEAVGTRRSSRIRRWLLNAALGFFVLATVSIGMVWIRSNSELDVWKCTWDSRDSLYPSSSVEWRTHDFWIRTTTGGSGGLTLQFGLTNRVIPVDSVWDRDTMSTVGEEVPHFKFYTLPVFAHGERLRDGMEHFPEGTARWLGFGISNRENSDSWGVEFPANYKVTEVAMPDWFLILVVCGIAAPFTWLWFRDRRKRR